jgi:hypothetical protein
MGWIELGRDDTLDHCRSALKQAIARQKQRNSRTSGGWDYKVDLNIDALEMAVCKSTKDRDMQIRLRSEDSDSAH